MRAALTLFGFLGLLMILPFFSSAQNGKQDTTHIRCAFTGCETPVLTLMQFDGFQFFPIQQAEVLAPDTFLFSLPTPDFGFYYISNASGKRFMLLLGEGRDLTLTGNCATMDEIQLSGSALNAHYVNMKKQMDQYRVQANQLLRSHMQTADEEEQAALVHRMRKVDSLQIAFLDSMRQAQPFLSNVVAVNTYLSFPGSGQDYPDQFNYFANTFFQFADFNDQAYAHNPWVYQSFREYAFSLAQLSRDPAKVQAYIEEEFTDIKTEPTRRMALSGILSGLNRRNDAYLYFAQLFVDEYGADYPPLADRIEKEIKKKHKLSVGSVAPDFAQQTPGGESLALSDLRGRVVLVDFWASWCGPCRKENPRVRSVYEKYRDRGFEILGVSLDRNKDSWERAIAADQLPWPQVSDLKGWKNEVAQLYQVRSIPMTYLIDEEGKVIAKNLRGASLERKLQEIFP